MNKVRSTDENVGAAYAERDENLLEWLYQLRDRQRQDQRQGAWLIKGRDLPWENNRQGKNEVVLASRAQSHGDSLDDRL